MKPPNLPYAWADWAVDGGPGAHRNPGPPGTHRRAGLHRSWGSTLWNNARGQVLIRNASREEKAAEKALHFFIISEPIGRGPLL